MKKFLLPLLLLSACAFDPTITRRAGTRRVAAGLLSHCLHTPPGRPWTEKACLIQSNIYCHEHGQGDNCGVDDLWTAQP